MDVTLSGLTSTVLGPSETAVLRELLPRELKG